MVLVLLVLRLKDVLGLVGRSRAVRPRSGDDALRTSALHVLAAWNEETGLLLCCAGSPEEDERDDTHHRQPWVNFVFKNYLVLSTLRLLCLWSLEFFE